MLPKLDRIEEPRTLCGIPGRYTLRTGAEGAPFVHQVFKTEARRLPSWDDGKAQAMIVAEIRFDDNCRNGRPSFAVTASIDTRGGRELGGGCCHEEIAQAFPEIAHLIRWHLCFDDGPMHYLANVVYMAGDRDYRGLRKGERKPLQRRDGKTQYHLRAMNAPGVAISAAHLKVSRDGRPYEIGDDMPIYALETSYAGDEPPAPLALVWVPQMVEGEGKERELDAARRAAVWPDATDAELCAEPDALRAALQARLPALIEAMRADIVAAGLYWSPADAMAAQ